MDDTLIPSTTSVVFGVLELLSLTDLSCAPPGRSLAILLSLLFIAYYANAGEHSRDISSEQCVPTFDTVRWLYDPVHVSKPSGQVHAGKIAIA